MSGPLSSEILTSGRKRKTDSGERYGGGGVVVWQMLVISIYMHTHESDAEYLQSTFSDLCLFCICKHFRVSLVRH